MKIEFLYSDGCPFAISAETNLAEVLFEEEINPHIERVYIASHEQALEHRFLGSPTIRVNGMDIEPHARDSTDYGIRCRLYFCNCGTMVNWPSKDMIRKAIVEAMHIA